MALTQAEILELVGTAKYSDVGRGRLLQMLRRKGISRAEREFLTAMHDRPTVGAKTYVHPEQAARLGAHRESEDLTPAELVWLQRLPSDPHQISHQDAAQLASLYRAISKMKNPSSKQLVESIWMPVKALHDTRDAQEELAAAKETVPAIPSAAVHALAEAIAADTPGLSGDELTSAAEQRIQTRISVANQQHARRLGKAEARVAEIEQSIAAQTATTVAVA